MKANLFPARILGGAKAYWKSIVFFTACFTWLFSAAKPDFGAFNRLSVTLFLMRVYWPEILVILATLFLILALLVRFRFDREPIARFSAWTRQCMAVVAQVSRMDRFYGLVVIIAAAFLTVPIAAKQLYKLVADENYFASVRLRYWYGDYLLQSTVRQINDGDYVGAIATLKAIDKELGRSSQARTARNVSTWLERQLETTKALTAHVEDSATVVGITRSDVLLQGAVVGMLPMEPVGAPLKELVVVAPQLENYLAALLRAKTSCANDGGESLTPRDVGMAISALGFARMPSLLLGKTSEPSVRKDGLCRIVESMSAESLASAHESAFSLTQYPNWHDWRLDNEDNAIVTTASTVSRALVSALDTAIGHTFGVRPLAAATADEARGRQGARREADQQGIEIRSLTLLAGKKLDAPQSDAFKPITYLVYYSRLSPGVHGFTRSGRSGKTLLLCLPSDRQGTHVGIQFVHLASGRIEAANSLLCSNPVNDLGERVWSEVALRLTIRELIEFANLGRMTPLVAVDNRVAVDHLCEVLANGAITSDDIRDAMRVCPIQTARRYTR